MSTPTVPFIGRADTDVAVAPAWLGLALRALLSSRRADGGSEHYYIGRVGWYSWHEREYRPVGFGFGLRQAVQEARKEPSCAAGQCSTAYPFARGPFILLSSARELRPWCRYCEK